MPETLKEKFYRTAETIKSSNHILIAGHTNPDGDSIGSMLGLYGAIKESMGKEVLLYSADPVPASLRFLPGADVITPKIKWYPDLIIGVDYGDFHRLSIPHEMTDGAQIITFDHHPFNKQRGDIKIIETGFSSTAELIFAFLRTVEWKISEETATCLLTGIFTDTGGFVHATSPNTLEAAAELMKLGAPIQKIYSETFAGKTQKILNVWGEFLGKIEIFPEYGLGAIFIPFDEFKKSGIILEDFTGLISMLNLIEETKFSIFAIEYESGKIKGSLRSDKFKEVDVSKIAKLLGGGGHKYAAGFDIEASGMTEGREKILNAVKKEFRQEE
ncbi:MAG: bifunctional oligoribonuclease/PAP phosphatase NrnA [Candidatus Spechtbacterales bacterium]